MVVLLGAGGMAEVYRARDTRLGRDVAIKMVSEALGSDGPSRERFEREARLAGSLSHPNVVALYDVGFQDGKPYLVTELLRGETLRERLAKGAVPLATALAWAAQIAEGLAAAHDRGIVHRDLKLENVFVTRDGHVKLLDFGIAKLAEVAREPHGLMEETRLLSHTGKGIVVGTPGYMSPEQVRGDPVDARTDFFSLGVLLYEMLTGRQAFGTPSMIESGYAILHSEPELPTNIPPPVAQVIRRCLEKDRGRRFQSARDLAFHLELLRTPTGSSTPTPVVSGVRLPGRGGRWAWALAGILAAVAISGATYFAVRSPRIPAPTVERITFGRGRVSAGRFTAEGRVVYSAAWGAGPEEVFTQSRASPDPQRLGMQNVRLLSVSAQDEFAVLLQPGVEGRYGTLAFIPGVGGVPREVSENILDADRSRTGELAVVRLVDGKRSLEYPLGNKVFESTGFVGLPRVSPDGNTVAFFSMPNDAAANELLLVDRKGAVRSLYTAYFISGLAWAPSGQEVWFTIGAAIWASPLKGDPRLVYQGVADMDLQDISREGRVLVNVEDTREETTVVPLGQRQQELPWLSSNFFNDLVAISANGRQVLVTAYSDGRAVAFVRPTDGSSSLKLGPGRALAFSPDEKWVLTTSPEDPGAPWLLPVGVGEPQKLLIEGLNIGVARWLRDGKRLVAIAQRKGEKEWRMLVVPLDGGAPRPLSDGPVTSGAVEVSLDDRFVASNGLDGTPTVYPLDGSRPIPLSGLVKGSVPLGWTSDGQLWVSEAPGVLRNAQTRLLRYDIPSHHVVEERMVGPTDFTGIECIERICVTPDSQTVALQYLRKVGALYLMDGLFPAQR